MFTKLYGYIAGLGAVILAILGALGMARRSGVKAEQQKEIERSLQQAKESNEIDAKNRALSDADALAKLRRDTRD